MIILDVLKVKSNGQWIGIPSIKGDQGETGQDGDDGVTFIPSVDASGNLSWSNDGGRQNPQTVNIKGPQGAKGDKGDPGDKGATGDTGNSGVYYGTTEPSDSEVNVWINPNGTVESISSLREAIVPLKDLSFYGYTQPFQKKANNQRLNESDGYQSSNSDYCLLKYQVVPGSVIRVVSDDRFQFQTSYTVNQSGGNYKVGSVYGTGDFAVEVPATATWLIVSTTKTDSGANVYLANTKDNKVNKFPEKVTANKFISYSTGNESSFTGLNYVTFNVVEGFKLQYNYFIDSPDSRGVYFYDASDGKISGVQVGTTAQEITVPAGAVVCKATVENPYQIYIKDVLDAVIGDLRNVSRSSTNPLSEVKETLGFISCFLHVGVIGDSLASGACSANEGGTTDWLDMYDFSWGQYLARATGNTYYNFSRGGLTTKSWNSSTYASTCFDGNHKCEAYIIGLGVNDQVASMSIGTSADINMSDYTQNADSFYGNYGKIIQRIKEHQPKAKVFVITMPDTTKTAETEGYNPVIRDMATLFDDVYVIDLYTYGTNIISKGFPKLCMRNGHYNAIGYQYISRIIGTYVDWIIENNPDEFNQIEFIGTNHSYTPPQ